MTHVIVIVGSSYCVVCCVVGGLQQTGLNRGVLLLSERDPIVSNDDNLVSSLTESLVG